MFPLFTLRLLPWALLTIRVGLAIVFIAHGGQKLFGLWGGAGISDTMESYERSMGIPQWLTFVAAATEFFGGLAVLIGLLTRLASLGLGVVILVAIFQAHIQHGFFINWNLVRGVGNGIEFHIALITMALCLLLGGPGQLSLDRYLKIEGD